MAIAVNRNTTQQPMVAVGRTGVQSIKFIPAPRVYVKAAETLSNSPAYSAKSNGTTPTGWIDLGTVDGTLKVNYTKKVNEVKTGIDNYFRAAYIGEKTGQMEFSLSQLDDVALEQITGLTASVITAGSVVSYQIGQEDLKQMAVLFVVQNKLDGKEVQYYNPAAYMNFTFAESSDAMVLQCTGYLPFFTAAGQTAESMLTATMFA